MKPPRTIEDVQLLITNKVMENTNLDYKDSRAIEGKVAELSKDVSSFANSDGGLLIYGIEEKSHLPVKIDKGVDHHRFNREWLEQVIQSNISPALDNLEIIQIPLNDSRSIYVISIPRSVRAPHQERQQRRYYKRYNFNSSPMEDYEINDLRNRKVVFPPLINIDYEIDQGVFIELFIENISNFSVTNLSFEFSEPLSWEGGLPSQFKDGIRNLTPRRKLIFYYSTTQEALAPNSAIVKKFVVNAKYYHESAGVFVTDSFEIDISTIDGTSIIQSELYHHGKQIEDAIKKLTAEIQKLNSHLEHLQPIAGPTGLNLSVTTLRHLGKLIGANLDLEELNPYLYEGRAFEEILGINRALAYKLSHYFRYGLKDKTIEDIEGIDKETLEKIRKYFKLDEM